MMGSVDVPQQKVAEQKSNTPLVNFGRICGAVGLVLLVSTPLTWLLTAEIGPLVWGKLIIGGFFVACYLLTNADFFGRVLGTRSAGLWALSAMSTVIVMTLAGVANYLAYKHSKEFDFTREGLYTLSDQTKSLLGRLQDDVVVMAFYPS